MQYKKEAYIIRTMLCICMGMSLALSLYSLSVEQVIGAIYGVVVFVALFIVNFILLDCVYRTDAEKRDRLWSDLHRVISGGCTMAYVGAFLMLFRGDYCAAIAFGGIPTAIDAVVYYIDPRKHY